MSQTPRKVKGKVHHEGSELEYKYSSTLSFASALDGVAVQRHAPAVLPTGETQYPLYRRLGGPQTGLDRHGKSRPHRDSIPRPSSP